MKFNIQNCFIYSLLLFTTPLAADNTFTPSHEFVEYHLKVAMDEVDEGVFNLIQENVNNLKNRDASDDSANELINLIEEGFKIDPFNMAKLIGTLTFADASNNAKRVIIKAI
jgi:hypothetical protein